MVVLRSQGFTLGYSRYLPTGDESTFRLRFTNFENPDLAHLTLLETTADPSTATYGQDDIGWVRFVLSHPCCAKMGHPASCFH